MDIELGPQYACTHIYPDTYYTYTYVHHTYILHVHAHAKEKGKPNQNQTSNKYSIGLRTDTEINGIEQRLQK